MASKTGTYGDAHNTSTDRAHIPLKASSFTLEEPDPLFLSIDEKRCVSQHQEALASSLFEWRLDAPLTISRFFYKLQDMRMDGHFPHYNLYGYDTRGGALNCVTFAMTLLKSLKGRESIPPHLLPEYQQPTALGHITGPMPLRSTGLGFLVGYCGSLLIMPTAWPLIALWAGVGAGAGAGVGLPLTYILNKQSEVRHMITLETVFNAYLKDKKWADIVTIKPKDDGGYAEACYEQYKNPFVLRALNTLRGQEKNVERKDRKPLHYVFGNRYSFVDDQSTNT
ncbi:hypothetical protein [Candidatus Hepatobacter penaei]|uniref:hypothetical protein n=1 Tax=Candidatus Hepatobacter penaei TaxID=1274402 RepID=UPI0004F29FA8|nr:hypothetical protein [Candidatus Hepatobacter penaei]